MADERPSEQFDLRLLEMVACPVCFSELGVGEAGISVVCKGCRIAYPLIDGIPVLIPERATGS